MHKELNEMNVALLESVADTLRLPEIEASRPCSRGLDPLQTLLANAWQSRRLHF